MKLFEAALLVAVNSTPHAGAETVPVSGFEACKADHVSQCNAAYESAAKQCSRYYLRETEAYALCHSSALKRNEICTQRVAAVCAGDKTQGIPDTGAD